MLQTVNRKSVRMPRWAEGILGKVSKWHHRIKSSNASFRDILISAHIEECKLAYDLDSISMHATHTPELSNLSPVSLCKKKLSGYHTRYFFKSDVLTIISPTNIGNVVLTIAKSSKCQQSHTVATILPDLLDKSSNDGHMSAHRLLDQIYCAHGKGEISDNIGRQQAELDAVTRVVGFVTSAVITVSLTIVIISDFL